MQEFEENLDEINLPELDEFEQDLEDNFELNVPIPEPEHTELKLKLEEAARNHVDRLNLETHSVLKVK